MRRLLPCLISLLPLLGSACVDGPDPLTRDEPWPSGEQWPTKLPDHPEDGSHFDGQADPFYEGWYHKVSIGEEEAFFFIYGVLNPKPGPSRHGEAFLYCGDSRSKEAVYQSFDVKDYSAEEGRRDVRIGPAGRATTQRIAGRAEQDGHVCSWDIVFDKNVPWIETMGWLTGHRGLETYWTVGTLRARAAGWVRFDDRLIEFREGIGYGDHNWGINFPKSWIWLQANAFEGGQTAVSVSGGNVPLGSGSMDAHMIGLLHEGKVITFRTQDGDQIVAEAKRGSWHISAEGRQELRRITVDATCDPDTLFHLLVSTGEAMEPRAWESLQGTVAVRLEERASTDQQWEVVLDATSEHAGVEVGE